MSDLSGLKSKDVTRFPWISEWLINSKRTWWWGLNNCSVKWGERGSASGWPRHWQGHKDICTRIRMIFSKINHGFIWNDSRHIAGVYSNACQRVNGGWWIHYLPVWTCFDLCTAKPSGEPHLLSDPAFLYAKSDSMALESESRNVWAAFCFPFPFPAGWVHPSITLWGTGS